MRRRINQRMRYSLRYIRNVIGAAIALFFVAKRIQQREEEIGSLKSNTEVASNLGFL